MITPANRAPKDAPVCRKLEPQHAPALASLFARLRAHAVETFFHPHPLTAEEASRLAAYQGRDFYCVLAQGHAVVGYGILRGWEEGYEVPSLGIVIDPSVQGRGYGRQLMEFLHATARQRGADRVRLKVYPENGKAVALYRSLGYEFRGPEDGQLIGLLRLREPADQACKETAG